MYTYEYHQLKTKALLKAKDKLIETYIGTYPKPSTYKKRLEAIEYVLSKRNIDKESK